MTSTACIDAGATPGATGPEPAAGSSSLAQAANAGARADFRSNWQEILKALTGANPAIENQAPSSPSRETLLHPNAKTVAQQGAAGLLSQISADTHQARSARTASSPEAVSHPPRKEHAQKLAANHGQLAVGAALAAGFDAVAVAAPVVAAPLPGSMKASPVVQDGSGFVESDPEVALSGGVAELASAAVSEVKANAFKSRANQAHDNTSEETVPSLGMRTDSSSSASKFAAAADENAVVGKEQSATSKMDPAPVHSVESRPASAQSPVAHAVSTIDDPPIRVGEEGTAALPSETGIAAATSLPGNHAEFAGAQKIVVAAGNATAGTQPVSGTATPAPLDSATAAQQARGESRPQQAAAADARVASASRVKPTATTSSAAAAGVPSAVRTAPPSYSAHAQNPAESADPLTAAVLTKSDGANDVRVARDAMQPQGTMGAAAHDPFAALDARTADAAPTWLHAGTHRAEAGYLDPSLGWVGVRAESSGNALHAAILPGSGEAAQALGGHLTALNSFLSEHQGRSSTVTLASPDQGHAQSGFNPSGGHSGEGAAQRQAHDGQARSDAATFTSQAATASGTRTQPFANPDAHAYLRDGAHISVIA